MQVLNHLLKSCLNQTFFAASADSSPPISMDYYLRNHLGHEADTLRDKKRIFYSNCYCSNEFTIINNNGFNHSNAYY